MGERPSDSAKLRNISMAFHKHERIRRDHATELAEDYVETIDDIISREGVCRAVDLVEHFQVTHATVSNAVGRLVRDGFARSEAYQPIELTAKGKKQDVTEFYEFYKRLGLRSCWKVS